MEAKFWMFNDVSFLFAFCFYVNSDYVYSLCLIVSNEMMTLVKVNR